MYCISTRPIDIVSSRICSIWIIESMSDVVLLWKLLLYRSVVGQTANDLFQTATLATNGSVDYQKFQAIQKLFMMVQSQFPRVAK